MKFRKTKKILIENYTIDYENDIICKVILKNQKISGYDFYTKKTKMSLTFVDDIELVKKTHWSEHYKVINYVKFNFTELKKFTNFDKLYYIGGGTDGIVKDREGNYISTLIHLQDSLFDIFCHVKNPNDIADLKNKLAKSDNIFDVQDVEIPYYNGGGFSIKAKMMISDDLYRKYIKKYADEYTLIKIIEDLVGETIVIPDSELA